MPEAGALGTSNPANVFEKLQNSVLELLFVPQKYMFSQYQLGLLPFKQSFKNPQTRNVHLNEVTTALNLTLVFVKQLYTQSFHAIMTDR